MAVASGAGNTFFTSATNALTEMGFMLGSFRMHARGLTGDEPPVARAPSETVVHGVEVELERSLAELQLGSCSRIGLASRSRATYAAGHRLGGMAVGATAG
jgi:hypothetical protein